MGVHDYISIIQRSKQNILSPLEEGCGATKASIILVPKSYSKEEILGWKLTSFAKFKCIQSKYSWDDWDFKDVKGYRKLLLDEKLHTEWWDLAIWESPSFPGVYLVNFEPDEYNAFVLEKIEPEKISREYYQEVFENRDVDMPTPKSEAYKKIIDCGVENLFEYRKEKLSIDANISEYSRLLKEIMSRKVLCSNFIYKLKNPPPELSRARLAILIKDNINEQGLFLPSPSIFNSNESGYCKTYSSDEATFEFRMTPSLIIELDDRLMNGCMMCCKRRWTGRYTCYNHISQEEKLDIAKHIQKIEKNASEILENLKKYIDISIPSKMKCSFEERGVQYNLQLLSVDKPTQDELRKKYGYRGKYKLTDAGYAKVIME